jgi:hypothetical protein
MYFLKFYIKSSPKTLKLLNTSHGKEAINSFSSYPTEFVGICDPKEEVSNLEGSFKKWAHRIFIWTAIKSRQTAE